MKSRCWQSSLDRSVMNWGSYQITNLNSQCTVRHLYCLGTVSKSTAAQEMQFFFFLFLLLFVMLFRITGNSLVAMSVQSMALRMHPKKFLNTLMFKLVCQERPWLWRKVWLFKMWYSCCTSPNSKNVNGLMSFSVIHSPISLHVPVVIIWNKRAQHKH